jgi:hypothetical protein
MGLAVIINLIAATTAGKGLVVDCAADGKIYPEGIKVPDPLFGSLNINRHDFHGERNYTVSPQYQNLQTLFSSACMVPKGEKRYCEKKSAATIRK